MKTANLALSLCLITSMAGNAWGGFGEGWDAKQWRIADGGNDHWYKWAPQAGQNPPFIQSYPLAKSYCEALGSHLLTVTSAAENEFIKTRAAAIGLCGSAWLGLEQDPTACEPGCGWHWITNEPWTWHNWADGEPNDFNNYEDNATIGLCSFQTVFGYWCDNWSPSSAVVMCEWEADCNQDGIIDYGQILSGQLFDGNLDWIPDICQPCPGDITGNHIVDSVDLAIVLSAWGSSGGEFAGTDINQDGIVNATDLTALLSSWGPCQ